MVESKVDGVVQAGWQLGTGTTYLVGHSPAGVAAQVGRHVG